jgi:hypothetical protein
MVNRWVGLRRRAQERAVRIGYSSSSSSMALSSISTRPVRVPTLQSRRPLHTYLRLRDSSPVFFDPGRGGLSEIQIWSILPHEQNTLPEIIYAIRTPQRTSSTIFSSPQTSMLRYKYRTSLMALHQ